MDVNTTVKGQITITDISDGRTANLYIEANHPFTQVWNEKQQSYVPNWNPAQSYNGSAGVALTLTPVMLVSGVNNPTLSDVKWEVSIKKDGAAVETFSTTAGNITSGTSGNTSAAYTNYGIYLNGNNLIVSKNMTGHELMKCKCTASYVESGYSNVTTSATVTFAKVVNGGSLVFAEIDCPVDTFKFTANGAEPSSITMLAKLFRGGMGDYDTTPGGTDGAFSVIWQEWNGSQWVNIVSGAKDSNQNTKYTFNSNVLTVYPAGVDNIASFRAEITDEEDGDLKYYAVQTLLDSSDPISMEIISTGGSQAKNGSFSSTLTPTLKRNGLELAAAAYKASYVWATDKSGATGWPKTSRNFDGGNPSITMTSSDIVRNGKVVITCTATVDFIQ